MKILAAIFVLSLSVAATRPVLRAQTTSGMVPFTIDHRRGALSSSPVDVSFLLDAPAGKHGFVQVKDGHLATADGQRIRFWGVNISDWTKGSQQMPPKSDAALWAETLARFGVNCVRLQFLDFLSPRGLIDSSRQDTEALNAEAFDREDYFIAELEKRGIYIDFNLLVVRPFKAGDGVQDAQLLGLGAKGTSLFDKRLIELQKEFTKQLLVHVNPYTKLKYTDDPGVAFIEINNENAINVGFRLPSPFYVQELTDIYNQWLAKHRTPEQIAKLRELAGVQGGETPVPLIEPQPLAIYNGPVPPQAAVPQERVYAEAEFFNDLQHDYFVDMENYVKQTLGSKSLVIASADHNHAASGYPFLRATSSMDVIDGHIYWAPPSWEYGHKAPMVNDPFNSSVVSLSRSAIAGKPYTVSETNNPFPSDYNGEGIPIDAAYGALQDWDAVMFYTFEPKLDPAWKPYIGDPYDVSLDPVKMPELAACALMFLRGDVEKARSVVERSYTRDQVFDSMLLPQSDRPYFTPGFPLYLPLEHEVRISSLDGPATQTFPQVAPPDPIVSDTKQLAWYTSPRHTGLVTIDTPRTQALIGFVRANGKAVSNLTAQVDNTFCTIQLSSLDAKPIAQSSKLLLVAGGRVENTGQVWNSAETTVTNAGGPPTLIEQVKGSITLRALVGARAVHLQPLDGAGQPIGAAIDAVHLSDSWKISLGEPVTTWYEITVQR
ncbi:MAG: hypothetical protein WBF35_08540 [Candidatus Acidiferrales bacterium]